MTIVEELALSIERLVYLIREVEWTHTTDTGISPLQRQVLWYIHTFPSRARATYIGRYLGVKKPTISLVLKQLEQKGFIRREPDPQNRRSQIIRLTDKGSQVIHQLRLEVLQQWLETLPSSKQTQLKEAFYGLFDHLHKLGVLVEVYFCATCKRFTQGNEYCPVTGTALDVSGERPLVCMHHSLLSGTAK